MADESRFATSPEGLSLGRPFATQKALFQLHLSQVEQRVHAVLRRRPQTNRVATTSLFTNGR